MSVVCNKETIGQKQSAGRSFLTGNYRNDVEECQLYFMKEHEQLISLANKQFGYNAWSHSITKQDIDCVDYIDGNYSVAASAVVKVVLKQGVYHEELGCGFSFGLANKAISIASARQEAKSDAFRKAMASFSCDIESEENIEGNQSSPVQGLESSASKNRSSSFQHLSNNQCPSKVPTATSPRNAGPSTSLTSPRVNAATTSVSEHVEQNLRAERKRKQQQLQEEYRSRMKLKEQQQNATNKETANDRFLINATIEDEPSFLSTQDVDEMLQSAAALMKPECPNYRMPLLSSPVQNLNHGWTSNNCVNTPDNSRSSRLYMN